MIDVDLSVFDIDFLPVLARAEAVGEKKGRRRPARAAGSTMDSFQAKCSMGTIGRKRSMVGFADSRLSEAALC